MKNSEFFGFALVWQLALCAGGLHGLANELFSIGPLEPGMRKEQVVRLIGPPDRTMEGEGFFKEFLFFEGLTVTLDEDELVSGVSSVSSSYCLYGKVCPGMAWDAAIAATDGMRKASSPPSVILLIGDGCNGEIRQEFDKVQSVEWS